MSVKLFKHQIDVLEKTTQFNRVAYYLDMGLGKTYCGSEKMIKLDARVNLVICQKSKVKDWVEHFKNNYAYPNNLKNNCYPYQIINLTGWKHEDFKNEDKFVTSLFGGNIIYIINYDLAFRRPELAKLTDFTLMLDESSLIQHKTTQRTKFIMKLTPKNVILLSGTPSSGKYENLWTQCKLLGYDINEELFLKQYVNFKKVDTIVGIKKTVDKDNPYKNFERLKRKLADYGAVFMKTEEVMDLPKQNFIIQKLSKPKLYSKFMKNSIVEVDNTTLVGDTRLTKRLYARQLCAMYNQDKYDAVKDLLESTQDRVVIFYNFNEELNRLKSIIGDDRPISEVNGSVKDLTNFENEDNTVLLVQYQAGAMGLNLQKANKIIYFSLTESSDLFEQSKKRIHRIGTTQPCFYYLLMCENTVEEDIYKALQLKQDYNDALFKKLEERK